MLTAVWWENLREEEHLEDRGVYGKIMLKWISEKWVGVGGMDWIYVAQNRDRW
jgi:hypothetical protein